MTEQKLIAGPIKGYKMTNDNLTCRDYQFELGVVHELDNNESLRLCGNGFHFCAHPSGVWSYYTTGRMFEIEAYDVLDAPAEPGAAHKLVARRIKLIREIKIGGNRNTGYYNTGDRNTGDHNTGDRNTGHYNTGDHNTGYCNTGYCNTGDHNTGDRNAGDHNTGDHNTGNRNTGDYNAGHYNTGDHNTGYCNTGDHNTGNRNTGDRNTGDHNTGYRNTGYRNTGHHNTGDYNYTDRSSGLFNTKPRLFMFDLVCNVPYEDVDNVLCYELYEAISQDEPFDVTPFLSLPNATEKRILNLHEVAKAKRQQLKERQQ